MSTFDIYKNGERVEAGVEGTDAGAALAHFASASGITGPVRRDGGGLRYVGDEKQGRYYARLVIDPQELAEWRAQYPGVPFGAPVVLAEAMRSLS